MISRIDKNSIRKIRHKRIRQRISGTPLRPRLFVFRSLKHIYAQIIDDSNGFTLASASSLHFPHSATLDAATQVGYNIAKLALDKGISQVVFDRGGYLFHGRVAALASAARDAGLSF